MLKKLNDQNFESEILSAKGTALIDFYADWCGPCKMLSPIIDEIASEREDITIGKINVDECQELAIKYGVMSIPTLIVIKDGKETERLVGLSTKDKILSVI